MVWEGAARLGYALCRLGLVAPILDLLVAHVAIRNGFVLWHVDGRLDRVRRFSPLRSRSFVAEFIE